MAFEQVEPFGSEAYYFGHEITASTVANVNRASGSKAYKPADFMPDFEREEQSADQMLQVAATITAAMGGRDLRPEADDG